MIDLSREKSPCRVVYLKTCFRSCPKLEPAHSCIVHWLISSSVDSHLLRFVTTVTAAMSGCAMHEWAAISHHLPWLRIPARSPR